MNNYSRTHISSILLQVATSLPAFPLPLSTERPSPQNNSPGRVLHLNYLQMTSTALGRYKQD